MRAAVRLRRVLAASSLCATFTAVTVIACSDFVDESELVGHAVGSDATVDDSGSGSDGSGSDVGTFDSPPLPDAPIDSRADAPPLPDAPIDGPMADAPMADAPMADAPMADAPMADAPMADAPMTDTPMTDAPQMVDSGLPDAPPMNDAGVVDGSPTNRQPMLSLDRSTIRLEQEVAEGPVEDTFAITNRGAAPLVVAAVRRSGELDWSVIQASPCPCTLAPDDSIAITARFDPSAPVDAINAMIEIDSNDPQTPTAVVALFGTGLPGLGVGGGNVSDETSFYACSANRASGSLVVIGAVLVGLRRRRRAR